MYYIYQSNTLQYKGKNVNESCICKTCYLSQAFTKRCNRGNIYSRVLKRVIYADMSTDIKVTVPFENNILEPVEG